MKTRREPSPVRVSVLVLLLIAACSSAAVEVHQPGGAASEGLGPEADEQAPQAVPVGYEALPSRYRRSATAGGEYCVAIAPEPDPIPLNRPFALEVLIFDAADPRSFCRKVEVRVDAHMPAHHHGMNRRAFVEQREDGGFVVKGMLMHMPGLWEITVDVFEGGVSERARFELDLDG